MWKPLFALVLLALAFGATSSRPAVALEKPVFAAHLSGRNEVPTNTARGSGLAVVLRQPGASLLTYRLVTVLTQDVVQAHIHCGAEGVNGPVVAFLFGPASPPVTINGMLAQGSIGPAQVISVPSSAACPGGISSLDDLIDKMEAGMTYVNVHTSAFPGGQIRGQLR
jgi:hypothetical protein